MAINIGAEVGPQGGRAFGRQSDQAGRRHRFAHGHRACLANERADEKERISP
jgi:hypothetical protein